MHPAIRINLRALVPVVPIVVFLVAMGVTWLIIAKVGGNVDTVVGLPLLAIGGVVLLLATLALVTVSLGILELTDKTQALALPEGSIRAVIALSLVVLFAIFAVFLYQGLAKGSSFERIESAFTRQQFLQANPGARDLLVVEGPAECSKEGASLPAAARCTFSVRYQNSAASEDFAKQMLTLIGTLMTAVVSFYFASKAVADAQKTDGAGAPPTLNTVTPASHLIGKDGSPIRMEISGLNLNSIKEVRLTNLGNHLDATNVTSSDSVVRCDVAVADNTARGAWDVTIVDGRGRSASKTGAVTIT
jgi:hypothetical protein